MQDNEFFNVLVEANDKRGFAFVTAYDIDQAAYRAYCNVPLCLYPVPKPGGSSQGKRGKRKKG